MKRIRYTWCQPAATLPLLVLLIMPACSRSAPPPPLPSLEGVEPQVEFAIREAHHDLTQNTGSAEAWGHYAMVLDVHDLGEPALAAYASACELEPGDFRWWYCRAVRLARTDPQGSLPFFETAKRLRPDYPALYVRYGRTLEQLGRFDDALAAFQRGVELDDRSALAHAGLGRYHLQAGHIDDAKQHLEKAIALDPQCAVALSSLAQLYAKTGDAALAETMTARANAAAPQDYLDDPVMGELAALGMSTGQIISRAQAMAEAGAGQQALDALSALVRANPGRIEAHIAKGEQETKLFRFEAAIASFRQALAIDPRSVPAHLGLAEALQFSRQLDDAIAEYRRVLELDDKAGRAYRGLAICLLQQEKIGPALQQFRKAVELLPEDRTVRTALGRLEFLELNDKAVIDTLAPVLASRDPGEPADRIVIDALLYTGLAHMRLGDEAAGQALLNEALAGGADLPSAARELGEIGKAELAISLLRNAVTKNPNDANAKMALAYELATTPQDDVRDSEEALHLIDSIIQQQLGGFHAQEIRAFALADKGLFTEAVQTLEQALSAARGSAPPMILSQYQQHIEQFKREQPFRHEVRTHREESSP